MTRRLQDIGLVTLAVLAAGLIFLAVRDVQDVPEPSGAAASLGTTPAAAPADQHSATTAAPSGDETAPAESSPELASAREVLASDEPIVVSVLGDSTSNARQEWVHRWAQELAAQRPVTISHWDEASGAGFVEPDVLSDSGDGSPVTFWSGSQSGATAAYPVDVLTTIIPEEPDVVVLNFGHNQSPDSAVPDFAALLSSIRSAHGDVPVVVVLQQPQVDDANAAVREAIAGWAQEEGLGTIDVAAAFLESDDYTQLLQDAIHPNDDGSRLWAQTVGAALRG